MPLNIQFTFTWIIHWISELCVVTVIAFFVMHLMFLFFLSTFITFFFLWNIHQCTQSLPFIRFYFLNLWVYQCQILKLLLYTIMPLLIFCMHIHAYLLWFCSSFYFLCVFHNKGFHCSVHTEGPVYLSLYVTLHSNTLNKLKLVMHTVCAQGISLHHTHHILS